MNGRHSAFVIRNSAVLIALCLVISAPVFAGDLSSPAYTPRQMAHCVMKRVRANTAETFRFAFKACKTEFEAVRSDRPPDAAVTAAALPEKPKQ